ncbi:GrpB family protein [Alteromonas sp. S015]|uniref:GrpB family protein n=1 Tax=Alteromonas sp. S015 TaxID=3117401 RepID=UPI002FE3A08B
MKHRERDEVKIVPYKKAWLEQFEIAKHGLSAALGDISICIDHIGSTSIPRMPAKDRIDIQIGVTEISSAICNTINQQIGNLNLPNAYMSEDHLPPNETHQADWQKIYLPGKTEKWSFKANIHIRKVGAKNFKYALLFRDYLRIDNSAAKAYATFKQTLASQIPDDRDLYSQLKDPVCDLIMISAKRWADTTK